MIIQTDYSLLQEGQSGVGVDPQVSAAGFAVVRQVGGPVPLSEQVQQLKRRKRRIHQNTVLISDLEHLMKKFYQDLG